MYYLNYFFIFSIIGHLIETIIFKMFDWNLESGFLFGYWTPIYGIGAILIIIISKYVFRKLKINKFLEVIIYLILIIFILTLVEFIGGNLLELLFHKVFWNYSDHKYHLGKFIALDVSLMWGVCSIILLYFIKPWMDKIVSKIPKFITYIFVILFIIDLTLTLILKLK